MASPLYVLSYPRGCYSCLPVLSWLQRRGSHLVGSCRKEREVQGTRLPPFSSMVYTRPNAGRAGVECVHHPGRRRNTRRLAQPRLQGRGALSTTLTPSPNPSPNPSPKPGPGPGPDPDPDPGPEPKPGPGTTATTPGHCACRCSRRCRCRLTPNPNPNPNPNQVLTALSLPAARAELAVYRLSECQLKHVPSKPTLNPNPNPSSNPNPNPSSDPNPNPNPKPNPTPNQVPSKPTLNRMQLAMSRLPPASNPNPHPHPHPHPNLTLTLTLILTVILTLILTLILLLSLSHVQAAAGPGGRADHRAGGQGYLT